MTDEAPDTDPRGGALIDPREVLGRLERIDQRTLDMAGDVAETRRIAELVLVPRAPRGRAERVAFVAACVAVVVFVGSWLFLAKAALAGH